MKTLFTTVTFCLVLSLANAQTVKEGDVPPRVTDSFKNQYPNVNVDKWEKEGANYEAEFYLNKVETSATYDERGKFIQSEVEIKITELPDVITQYINTNLVGKKIKEASKITEASGLVNYEAEIDDVDYIFDANGSLIKKEQDDEKGDEDN